MIYRYVSAKEVLAKVARDLKPQNTDWEQDVLEWIGEALEYIGSGAAYELKRRSLSIFNYRALLPLDLRELKGVFTPEDQNYSYGDHDYIAESVQISGKDGLQVVQSPTDGYFINGGYLIMPFAEGEVVLEYEGLKLDDEGFPLIPDAIQYRNAIFFYILRQMIMGGFQHPDRQMTYLNVDQLWKQYCGQAQNKGGFPSVDKAMNFGRTFVSLLPTIRYNKPKLSDV